MVKVQSVEMGSWKCHEVCFEPGRQLGLEGFEMAVYGGAPVLFRLPLGHFSAGRCVRSHRENLRCVRPMHEDVTTRKLRSQANLAVSRIRVLRSPDTR